MNKIKYIRKYLFETDKHFESRVNETLNDICSNVNIQITSTIIDLRYIIVFYTETINVNKSKTKVKGFCLTSNEI